jgi:hypothetical protein
MKTTKNRAKAYGINKGTRRLIIKQVLIKGSITKPELMKAIPNVSDRCVRRELAQQRSKGIVLSVISSTGGVQSNMTVVSLNHMLREAFVDYGELSPREIEKWSSALAIADSAIRSFLSKSKRGPSDVNRVKSKLRYLLESFQVGSAAEKELLNEIRGILEGIAGIRLEDLQERHHARVDNGLSRNRPTLNQRRSLRQPKAAKRSLRASPAAMQEGACQELPGGWLEKGRRTVRKISEIVYRRVGEVLGSV